MRIRSPRNVFGSRGNGRQGACPVRRCAFTLIELLIIVSILGILAAVVFPVMTTSTDSARVETLATNATHVKEMIIYQAGLGGVPLSAGGSPLVVDPAWFPGGKMPNHAWTGQPMIVQTVSLADTVVFPAVKIFNPLIAGAKSTWYNSTNGAFCALVPPKATDAETLALFNSANKSGATSIHQTTN